jgi:hypothetical protein
MSSSVGVMAVGQRPTAAERESEFNNGNEGIKILKPLHCNLDIWSSSKQANTSGNNPLPTSTANMDLGLTSGNIPTHVSLGKLTDIYVYPNPSKTGRFTIECDSQKVVKMNVIDINGKEMPISIQNGTIDLSGYPNGVYILNVNTSNSVLKQKLIVNK